jgi:large subunit ribosomal protein L10
MLRERKRETVAELRSLFESSAIVLIAHYHGLTTKQMNELRSTAREQDSNIVITKNTLAKLAVKDTEYSDITSSLTGPIMIATAKDAVSVAKLLSKFAEENEKLSLVRALINGKSLDVSGIKMLAKLPSLDELRAKIISILQTPATRIASVITAPMTKFARVTSAYARTGA